MKLLLWDIDGTLMSSGGAGTRAMDRAFHEVFSVRGAFRGIRMSGKTDPEIWREALEKHGFIPDGKLPLLMEIYVKHLKFEISNPNKMLMPGIREALQKLHLMEDFSLGLLTGNIERGARIKLEAFLINHYFPVGAFGSDDEDRNKLLPIAVQRFNAFYNANLAPKDCIVIGDTPRDIACARPYGAHAVCVATGRFGQEDLRAAGADIVFGDLSDTGAFLRGLNLIS
jgi:phosphoglycolate phosphatase